MPHLRGFCLFSKNACCLFSSQVTSSTTLVPSPPCPIHPDPGPLKTPHILCSSFAHTCLWVSCSTGRKCYHLLSPLPLLLNACTPALLHRPEISALQFSQVCSTPVHLTSLMSPTECPPTSTWRHTLVPQFLGFKCVPKAQM